MTLLAAWGALQTRPALLFVAFAVSFFPVGLYLLGVPSVFALIGVCHLLYLTAGLLMLVGRRVQGRHGQVEHR